MAKGTKGGNPKPKDSPVVDENDDLSSILEKTSVTFQGHPADVQEGEGEEVVDDAAGPKGNDGDPEKPAGEVVPPQERPPKEKPVKEGRDGREDPLEVAQDTIKTLEQRVKDNQRSYTESREESKKYREQVDKLSGQLQDLMVEIAKGRVTPPTDSPQGDPLKGVEDELSKMLDAIENLDPTDAQYRPKTVQAYKVMLGKFREALNTEVETKLSLVKTETEKRLEEQRRRDDADRSQKDQERQINDHAEAKARESGLDMRADIEQVDESGNKSKINSADRDLFWRFAAYAKGDTTDEKIEWTIDEVKRVKAMIGQPIVRSKEKARETQKSNSVLERGGSRPPESSEDDKPISFADAIQKAQRTL